MIGLQIHEKKIIFSILLAFVFVTVLFASQTQKGSQKNIKYFYRISKFPTLYPDSTLVRFDIAIPYNDLVFIASDSVYKTGVKFNLFVTDKEYNAVFEKNWRKKVEADNYPETQSETTFCRFDTKSVFLSGKYKIILEAIDENIGISEFTELQVKIPDQSKKKAVLGDLLIYPEKHDFSVENYENFTPQSGNTCRTDFTLLSIIYLRQPIENFKTEAIWWGKNREIRQDSVWCKQDGNFLILYRPYSIRDVPQGLSSVQFRVSGKEMKKTASEIQLEVIKQVDYFDEESIDDAIEQMVYIGEGAAWDSLRNADTLAEKKKWFNRFWQEYSPASDSLKNPVEEEYFRRVRFAIRQFDEGDIGWRTDRGKTYILYGPPNDIQKSMDSMMRNMEIWVYNNIEKQFLFVDITGSGTYRLMRVYD